MILKMIALYKHYLPGIYPPLHILPWGFCYPIMQYKPNLGMFRCQV